MTNNIDKSSAYSFFTKFLVDNDCYDRFSNAVILYGRYKNKTIVDIFNIIEKKGYNYDEIINIALLWTDTEEGSRFWLNLHSKYLNIYRKFVKNYTKYGNEVNKCRSIW